ncbi:tetratricopeptide repeat-containing sulfotransferase family protein [Microbulbifer mangrovi]|uniref:tetratricopeptide repeat-containing sulfotransferase family protein n=1 Tax=Microbulbifer mangrovi TaxID=927787 RepID=UPI00099086C5|nr:sulfotransferase [Microbulbifer mangrovi]
MNIPPNILKRLQEARALAENRRFTEAEQIYRALLSAAGTEELVYRELFHFYVRQENAAQAVSCLEEMARHFSGEPEWWLQLAQYAQSCGDDDKAILGYRKFLEQVTDRPNTVYNFAYLLKQVGKLEEALSWYQKALDMGVSGKEEVYTNIGVILSELRREPEARASYEKALQIRQDYLPALLNLAALSEESGDRDSALEQYSKVLAIDSENVLALSRLAHLSTVDSSSDPLIEKISSLLAKNGLSRADQEELGFALGKLLDGCGEYGQAFTNFAKANNLGKSRFKPYSKGAQSRLVDKLIQAFSPETSDSGSSIAGADPVFICGMFRSGSTLVEQVLSGHSAITSGGELDFFPRLIHELGGGYPESLGQLDAEFFERAGADYRDFLSRRFDPKSIVTDKRPDNFLHVGLIKRALPSARFIWTRRGLLDNCLSIYFQQLGGGMNYSTDLEAIGHYFVQQERLMRHWQCLFPQSICEVEYETLVVDPEKETRRLLNFLGLNWESGCLNFQERKNYVKTASVWQVRKGMHTGSVKRYQNYRSQLSALGQFLQV